MNICDNRTFDHYNWLKKNYPEMLENPTPAHFAYEEAFGSYPYPCEQWRAFEYGFNIGFKKGQEK